MFRYVFNRLTTSVVLALFATLVVFLIASLVPGDPILAMLGDLAASKPRSSPSTARAGASTCRCGSSTGSSCSGSSTATSASRSARGRPVLADIAQYAPATIELGTIAFVLSM